MTVALFFLVAGVVVLNRHAGISLVIVLLILLAFIPVIQYSIGLIPFLGDAIIHSLYILGAALAFHSGASLSLAGFYQKSFFFLSIVFLILGLFSVYIALYQFLGLSYLDPFVMSSRSFTRVLGNLAQSNNFSTSLLCGILSAWYLFEKGVYSKVVYFVILIFMALAIALAQSRTALLVTGATVFLFFIYKYRINFKSGHFFVMMVPMLILFWLWGVSELFDNSIRNFSDSNYSAQSPRILIWTEMVMAIFQGPLWGYGWGQVTFAQLLVDSPYDTSLYTHYSHNFLLDLIIWNGPIIGLIIILAIALWLWRLFSRSDSVEDFIAMCIISSIGIHALLEFPLSYTYFLFPLFFILGLLNNVHHIVLAGWPKKFYILCASIMLISFGGVILLIYKDYRLVEEERYYSALSLLNEEKVDRQSNLDKVILFDNLRDKIRFNEIVIDDSLTDESLALMKRVAYAYPSYSTLVYYSRACRFKGLIEEANKADAIVKRMFKWNTLMP